MMFEKNSFIRWVGKDADGEFTYTGQFKKMHGDTVIFETVDGIVGVHKDDGKFETINKPKNWNKQNSVPVAKPVEVEKPKKQIRPASGGVTKLDQCIALLRANPDLINNRKAAIEKIVSEVGMTPAGASTYFSNAKKAVV